MHKTHRIGVFLVGLCLLGLGLGTRLSVVSAMPTEISADITNNFSQPFVQMDDTWSVFEETSARLSKNGLVVNYPVDVNFAAYPLSAGASTQVFLRPSSDPSSELLCVPFGGGAPALGTCSYETAFNQVRIYYTGNLVAGQAIRYRILNLESADPANFEFVDFDTEAVFLDGISATEPTARANRPAAQLMLVLDKSGSMGWSSTPQEPGCAASIAPPPPGCGPSRWEVLNDAVTQLMTIAKAYGLPIAVEDFPGDQFGAAFFDGDLDTRIPGGTSGLNSLDISSIDAFLSTLSGISPQGSTSIGAGLLAFDGEAVDATQNQFVLLFSDGEQNRAPFVVINNALSQVGTNPTANNVNDFTEFLPGVNICPFAMVGDAPASPNITLMQDIASLRCSDLTYADVDISDEDMLLFFIDVMNTTLIGDKLETSVVRNDVITNDGAIQDFNTSATDVAFTVLVRLNESDDPNGGDNQGFLDLTLVKDDVLFRPFREARLYGGTFAERGDGYVSVTYHQPFCNLERVCVDPEGEWTANIVTELAAPSDYSMIVVADNQYIATEYTVEQAQAGVGQPLLIEIDVSDSSIDPADPIKLQGEVIVRRPVTSLGNLLVDLQLDPSILREIEDEFADILEQSGDSLDAVTLLIQQLADRGIIQEAVLPEIEERFSIEDAQVDDGLVRIEYLNTDVEGIYEVEIRLEGESSGLGAQFQRFHKETVAVPVVPVPEAVLVDVNQIDGCNFAICFELLLELIDEQGNFVGPGKANGLSLIVSPEEADIVTQEVFDNLNSTYTMRVFYRDEPSFNPQLNVFGLVPVPLELFPGLDVYRQPQPRPTAAPTLPPQPTVTDTVQPTITNTVQPTITITPSATQPPVTVTLVPMTPTDSAEVLFWEYVILDIEGPDDDMPEILDAIFNELGALGWEFIGEFDDEAVFRRPRD